MHLVILGLIVLAGPNASAYLQYSLRNNQVACTACHYSPVGGGPKTIYGKLYGAHNFAFHPGLPSQYFSADFRALYYRPEDSKTSKGGMGIMSGSVAGHAAVDENERVWLVLEHNIAGFAAAPYRDTYALFRGPKQKWAESLMVGRFRAPFGFVTDEHRTYARVQTNTEYFTFETGLMLSGTPLPQLHYNLALVNGAHSTGQSLGADQANQWGVIGNLRWLSSPFLFGLSGEYCDPSSIRLARNAWSLYGGFNWDRWTLIAEHSRARGFNSNLGRGFAASAAYVDSIAQSRSAGWLGWLELQLNERFALIYKFDFLTPDDKYPADSYERHGLGFRWAIAPLTSAFLRVEKARATPPSEAGSSSVSKQDAAWAILEVQL